MKGKYFYDKPLYACFKRVDGKLYGYIMGSTSCPSRWSETNVTLLSKEDIAYYQKIGYPFMKYIIVRLKSKKCPVEVELDPILDRNSRYLFWGNKKFKEKLTTKSK